jgi:thymidylate synthase
MILFEAPSADAAWRQAVGQVRTTAPQQEGRDQTTRELVHAAFTLRDPRQRVVFGRVINPAFALAEVLWILAGANDVRFLQFWNPRMKRFSDNGAWFHGAYGYRLGAQPALPESVAARLRHATADAPRVDQLRGAFEALRETPASRQVVLQIWDHALDLPDPAPRSKDIPCNIMSHLLLREGKLEWLQVMRSNDLIWGTPYNFIQWTTVQEIVAGWLGVEVGTYNHISDSLHVYQRHWEELDAIQVAPPPIPTNQADLRLPYGEWEAVWGQMLTIALALAETTEAHAILALAQDFRTLPAAYQEWGAVLTAEALVRHGHAEAAQAAIAGAGPFWGASWRQWSERS